MDREKIYRSAIEWIAYNDEILVVDQKQIAEMISVCLVADIFGVEPINIAKEIILIRRRFK